jgi:hypothetical protein
MKFALKSATCYLNFPTTDEMTNACNSFSFINLILYLGNIHSVFGIWKVNVSSLVLIKVCEKGWLKCLKKSKMVLRTIHGN